MSKDVQESGKGETAADDDRPRSGMLRGMAVYIGVVAALLLAAGAVYLGVGFFSFVPPERSSPRLERALEAAKAAGVPVSWDEYWAGVEMDGPNGADYYTSAFALFLENPANPNGPSEKAPKRLPLLSNPPVPFPAPGEEVPDALRRRVGAYLEPKSAVFEYVHEGSKCTWSRYVTWYYGAETLLPHLSHLRHCTRFLALAAWHDAVEGRPAAAVERVEDALALSNSLKQEPFLISQVVRFASVSITLQDGLQEVLMHCEPSAEDLAALQRKLEAAAADINLETAFGGEAWSLLDFRERVLNDKYEVFRNFRNPSTPQKEFSFFERRRIKKGIDAFTAQNMEALLFFREAAADPPPALLTGETAYSAKNPVNDPFFSGFDSARSCYSALVVAAETRAKLKAAAAALAALRFRREIGRWPETLDELAPEYIESVPRDPFTGGALIYRILDDGIMIYSVGANGVDDSGKPTLVKPPEGTEGEWDDRGGFRLILPAGAPGAASGDEPVITRDAAEGPG